MKLYIARHGETTWNAQKKVSGRTDVPLTEKGMEQARRLAERMSGLPIDVIFASPLQRARHTAECIAEKLGLPVLTEERLIEQDYGIYEGVDCRTQAFLNNKRQFAFRYPQGESMMQVAARTYGLIEELRRKYSGKNVLLVCHGGVIRVMKTYFTDMSNEEFFHYSMDNCGYLEYELEDLPKSVQPETDQDTAEGKSEKKLSVAESSETVKEKRNPEDKLFDTETSVQMLKDAVAEFNEERGWTGLNAANLAMSINIEASELLEIFQWCDPGEADEKARVTEREHFLEELADVMIYCIGMANFYDVDLADCIREKMGKNALKYPVQMEGEKQKGKEKIKKEDTYAGDPRN